jgi:hypothetical protein
MSVHSVAPMNNTLSVSTEESSKKIIPNSLATSGISMRCCSQVVRSSGRLLSKGEQ